MKENSEIVFVQDGKIQKIRLGEKGVSPTTTVLNYLRNSPEHKGSKEGCAEGDCGACTVVIAELGADEKLKYIAIDSCLVFMPMLHGKQLLTVENLQTGEQLHPVQEEMVQKNGSQCGYCTPGFIMSMLALYKETNQPGPEEIRDALTGNLCRCTGYRPIVEAAASACAAASNCGAASPRPFKPAARSFLRRGWHHPRRWTAAPRGSARLAPCALESEATP